MLFLISPFYQLCLCYGLPLGRAEYPQRTGVSVPPKEEFWASDGGTLSSLIASPP